jgi:hypothetical protein
MAAFKNLFGFKEKKSFFPVEQVLIADKLTAVINEVEVTTPAGPLACWLYGTSGFQTMGQKEIFFLLVREKNEPSESFPKEPLSMLANFEPLIEKGLRYDIGDFPDFGGPGPFGRQLTFVAPMALMAPAAIEGADIPQDALVAFLVNPDERESIEKYGITRFTTRLGRAAGVFPYPLWSHRTRSFFPAAMDRDTVLEDVERVKVPRMIVYQEGDAFYLMNQPELAAQLRDELPALVSSALLTGPDPQADAHLVWDSKQSEPQAHIQPGKSGDHLGASFLILVPGQDENTWEIYEDGFTWQLTPRAWEAARKVLLAGRSIKATMVEDKLTFAMI